MSHHRGDVVPNAPELRVAKRQKVRALDPKSFGAASWAPGTSSRRGHGAGSISRRTKPSDWESSSIWRIHQCTSQGDEFSGLFAPRLPATISRFPQLGAGSGGATAARLPERAFGDTQGVVGGDSTHVDLSVSISLPEPFG